jgi:lysophospholipase L1-like esterase
MHRYSVYVKTAFVMLLSPALLLTQSRAPAAGAPPPPVAHANVPLHSESNDIRHRGFVDIARKGNIDLLFVGDSITDGFSRPLRGSEAPGGRVWKATFAPLKAANFGIAGERTQGALWRMRNGELEGFKAKLIVLLLGTNNIGANPSDEIVAGERLIIQEFKRQQPQAKVLLLGIFPRPMLPTSPVRAAIKEINSKLAKLADNRRVFYKDIGSKFLTADGILTEDIMSDGIHPTARGYQIWADAIIGDVMKLMR